PMAPLLGSPRSFVCGAGSARDPAPPRGLAESGPDNGNLVARGAVVRTGPAGKTVIGPDRGGSALGERLSARVLEREVTDARYPPAGAGSDVGGLGAKRRSAGARRPDRPFAAARLQHRRARAAWPRGCRRRGAGDHA